MSSPSVAVFGSGGNIGKYLFDFLSKSEKIQFPIKVVTRDIKNKTSTSKLEYIEGEISEANVDKLSEQLKGVDVIVSLTPASPPANLVKEKILQQVKPQIYVPTQYGLNGREVDQILPGMFKFNIDHVDNVRAIGGIKVVEFLNGFFIGDGFLTEIVGHAGIDTEKKTVTYANKPETKVPVTYLPDIANAIVGLITLEPSEVPQLLKIQSAEVSFEDIAKLYEKNHNVSLKVETVPLEEVVKQANDRIQTGKALDHSDFSFIIWVASSTGRDKGGSYSENDNELINPGEKSFKWTKFH